jgi:putative phosphoesterase
MTRIIALSDTHLERGLPERLVELAEGADFILHAGDFVAKEVYDSLADLGRVEAVCGNSDSPELKMLLPERKVIEVDGVRIGLVHLASHSTGPGTEMLAREMEVDVLVYGHLHRPIVEKGNKLLICPGSPTVPRMSPPTVAEIEIKDGNVTGRIVPVGEPTCDYIRYAQSLENSHKK